MRILGYIALGLMAFCLFFYWSFPYDLIKERLVTGIEQQLGSNIDVKIDTLSPNWFTGVKLKNFRLEVRTADGVRPLWQAERVKIRVGLFSLLFGHPRVKFSMRSKSSRVTGAFQRLENGFQMDLELDPLELSEFPYIRSATGMNLAGTIAGTARLQMNTVQMAQTQGQIQLDFKNWKLKKGSKLPYGITSPEGLKEDVQLTTDHNAGLKATITKGVAEVGDLRLNGDVDLDVKGEAFLSQKFANVRLNISGPCKFSPKANEELKFLYLLEKQKQPDGTYPLTVAGNLTKPQIKVGDFLVPF